MARRDREGWALTATGSTRRCFASLGALAGTGRGATCRARRRPPARRCSIPRGATARAGRVAGGSAGAVLPSGGCEARVLAWALCRRSGRERRVDSIGGAGEGAGGGSGWRRDGRGRCGRGARWEVAPHGFGGAAGGTLGGWRGRGRGRWRWHLAARLVELHEHRVASGRSVCCTLRRDLSREPRGCELGFGRAGGALALHACIDRSL